MQEAAQVGVQNYLVDGPTNVLDVFCKLLVVTKHSLDILHFVLGFHTGSAPSMPTR